MPIETQDAGRSTMRRENVSGSNDLLAVRQHRRHRPIAEAKVRICEVFEPQVPGVRVRVRDGIEAARRSGSRPRHPW